MKFKKKIINQVIGETGTVIIQTSNVISQLIPLLDRIMYVASYNNISSIIKYQEFYDIAMQIFMVVVGFSRDPVAQDKGLRQSKISNNVG